MNERDELIALRRLAALEAKQTAYGVLDRTEQQREAARLRRELVASMPWYEKAGAGFGKAVQDFGRGVGQLVGVVSRDDVKDSRRLDAELMDDGWGMAGNVAGNAAILAPAAMIPGANTITGGAAIGTLSGLIQPSTSTGETLTNMGVGAAGGAFVPAVSSGWRAGKAALEPFSQKGQNRIVGRALNSAAGSDAAAVMQRLEETGKPFVGPNNSLIPRTTVGEFVPGSIPTVGQAAENSGVAALERAAAATQPDVTQAVTSAGKAQNAARRALLGDMAGEDGAYAFAVANRDATAEQLYGAARRIGVDPAKLTPEVLQNIANFSQRIPDSVLNEARKLAKIKGTPMTDATSVEGMHWIKMAIDGEIGAAKRAGNDTLARAYVGLQQDLLSGLDKMSPAYAAARGVYHDMSRPVNQMEVAQSLIKSSVDPLTGAVKPSNYARALNDKTAAAATGIPSATLAGTMENSQLNALESLLLDLQRSSAAQNAGRGAGSDTVQKLAYSNILDRAGVPTLLRNWSPSATVGNLVGRGADAAYGRANRELANKLAQVMLDPAQAAELMKIATPAQQNALLALVNRGASGLAIAAPSSANSAKQ